MRTGCLDNALLSGDPDDPITSDFSEFHSGWSCSEAVATNLRQAQGGACEWPACEFEPHMFT